MTRAPSLAARLALGAIRGYQRYLSPIKGFSCALRGATGGDSCSAYGRRVIARHGLRTGMRLLRRRLDACGRSHRAHAPAGPLRMQAGFCEPSCDLPCDASNVADCGCCDFDWGRKDRKRANAALAALKERVKAAKRDRRR